MVRIPPPLEALPQERDRPTSFLDHVSHCLQLACEDPETLKLANTVDTVDSVTGALDFDKAFLARKVKDIAGEHGFPDVANAKEKAIAKKFEWAKRRRDTPELPVSRNARLALLAAKEANDQIANGG